MPTDSMPTPEEHSEFEATARTALERVEDTTRKIGLYVHQSQVALGPGGELVLLVDFLIGDVAFSDRVQDPQKQQDKQIVNTMERSMVADELIAARDRLERNLKAGRNAYDDGDDPPS